MEVSALSGVVDTIDAEGIAAVEVVSSIAVVVFAIVAHVDKKSVVDTVVEMVRVAATVEMIPSWYFVVAILVADIVDIPGLAVVASYIPLTM